MNTSLPCLLVALALNGVALATPNKEAAAKDSQCAELNAQIGALGADVDNLRDALDAKKSEIDRSHKRHHEELDKKTAEAKALAETLQATQDHLASAKRDGEAKGKRLAQLERDLADARKAAEAERHAARLAMAAAKKEFEAAHAEALAHAGKRTKADAATIAKLNGEVAGLRKNCQEAHVALAELRKTVAEISKAVSATQFGRGRGAEKDGGKR